MNTYSTSPVALIVDDEAMIRMDACAILEDAGFKMLEAASVQGALDTLAQHEGAIILLLTDVQMPGGRDGFDLAWETSTCWPAVWILIASGHAQPAPGEMPDGAIFMGKPFTQKGVYAHLSCLIPEHHQPDALKQKLRSAARSQ
jgi:FixJ family two-component response regulator